MRSYTCFSMSVRLTAGTPVGMMAWWSVTFDESNTRLDFLSGLPASGATSASYPLNPLSVAAHLG